MASLRAALKKGLLEYLQDEDAHIVALKETKFPPRKRPNNVTLEEYHGYFEDAETPGYAGFATLTKAMPLNVIHGIGDHECDK